MRDFENETDCTKTKGRENCAQCKNRPEKNSSNYSFSNNRTANSRWGYDTPLTRSTARMDKKWNNSQLKTRNYKWNENENNAVLDVAAYSRGCA